MDRTEMDEIMGRHYAAEAAHDLEALMGTLAEGAVHDVIGDPDGALSDPADIRCRYAQLFADFDNERVTPIRRLYGDDFMVDEAMVTARAVGQPFGLPGGNREVTYRLLHVCEFRDGGISSEHVWLDVAAIVAQLAPSPEAAEAAV
ncbi:hypothetical protein GCM10023321_76840 [Pseudonocardia eucalypti]|uniref:SnoaL-like domain-containing protein n=1 Tax=Pseudonocardia eucalypti TaxID=648755 RepID=A0ABP9RB01_9PSEU|nr:hypothetical protein [Pseudonocardia eucalypti]